MLAPSVPRISASPLLLALFALNGVTVSTLYWAQSLAPLARAELGPSIWMSQMPSATLVGYALGVAALAGLARDLTTANGLGLHALLLGLGLGAGAVAQQPPLMMLASLVVGIGCSLTQRALACAASAVSPASRGPVIGGIIASGLAGIVAARALVPAASAALGWRTMFMLDAGLVCCCGIGAAIAVKYIDRRGWEMDAAPVPGPLALWRSEPVLRRAALQQGLVFAMFNFGWALFPRLLIRGDAAGAFWMGSVASFGAGAALAAGWACRRWRPGAVSRLGLSMVIFAGVLALQANGAAPLALIAMALLDVGTQTSLVANQARAQALATSPAMRGRLAAMVTTTGFTAGAVGAALGNVMP
ncbi:MAG: hypothetical protein RQ966_11760 [Acetobacteraceae bacterium]|nr:hypothetical protein [Acetobacteraceae bacterium]